MFQKLTIIGNVGRDPETRYTANGQMVVNFSVATNRNYTGSDGQKTKEVTWFRVTVFGNQAEACANFLNKGDKVMVEGRLECDHSTGSPRVYESKNSKLGYAASFEVVASYVLFLQTQAAGGGSLVGDDDQIPF